MNNLSFSLFVIFAGLSSGYLLRQVVNQGYVTLPFSLTSLAKWGRNIGITVIIPLAFLLAIWVTSLSDHRLFLMPFIGLATLVFGGICGYLIGVYNKSSDRDKAVLFCSTSFTNIGAVGSLVCYLFLGEAGFALVTFYRFFEEVYYFTVGYPVTQMIGDAGNQRKEPILQKLLRILKQPFLQAILLALTIGVSLNLLNVERPAQLGVANNYLIPCGAFILLFSVGLGLRFSSIKDYLKLSVHVATVRATVVPLFAVSLAWALGLGEIDNGLALGVVLILSAMPTAVNAIVATSVYDLDIDLANSAWAVSTASMAIVLPCIYMLIHLLGFGVSVL